jgi:hypothetical protein
MTAERNNIESDKFVKVFLCPTFFEDGKSNFHENNSQEMRENNFSQQASSFESFQKIS